jgi:selenocysteine-specific translation elongation factor
MEELKEKILSIGRVIEEENAELSKHSPRIIIDNAFNVTGIGCVVLGVVTQGTIHKKDKMTLFPIEVPIEIRSIQVHDIDVNSASVGSRVGLALKNVQSKNVERGYVISKKENVESNFTLRCKLSRFTKEIAVGDMLHLFVGLQSTPVRLERILIDGDNADRAPPDSECLLTLSGSKNIAYSKSDRFLLANLDERQRFVGYGII